MNPNFNFGGSTQLIYDTCDYERKLCESVSPGAYRLYFGQAENEHKCIYDNVYFKQDPILVETESELKNIRRPYSHCDRFKYRPNCPKSRQCMSTFDNRAAIVPDPSLCPIVHNNIRKPRTNGFGMVNATGCNYAKF